MCRTYSAALSATPGVSAEECQPEVQVPRAPLSLEDGACVGCLWERSLTLPVCPFVRTAFENGLWYPGATSIRAPNKYGMTTRDGDLSGKLRRCHKTSPRHPNLTPGVFAAFCPHGVCLGFVLLPVCPVFPV